MIILSRIAGGALLLAVAIHVCSFIPSPPEELLRVANMIIPIPHFASMVLFPTMMWLRNQGSFLGMELVSAQAGCSLMLVILYLIGTLAWVVDRTADLGVAGSTLEQSLNLRIFSAAWFIFLAPPWHVFRMAGIHLRTYAPSASDPPHA